MGEDNSQARKLPNGTGRLLIAQIHKLRFEFKKLKI
jgi:hypothetical protein